MLIVHYRKRSYSFWTLSLFIFLSTFACQRQEALIYMGKNAYEEPVWLDLLQKDTVYLTDVEKAFHAYASKHEIEPSEEEYYEKAERHIKASMNSNGYVISEKKQYQNLLHYRKALPNQRADTETYDLSQTIFFFDIPNVNGQGNWENIGPFGNPEVQWAATGNGALQYIEMHPTNPAIMYACSRNGGLWKTTNYAQNWEPITQHFSTPHTSCIEVCPQNPNTIYLGAAQDGIIWYSTDEGNTWTNRSTGLSGEIYDVHSDPINANRALVATTDGIYLTTDAGLNWVQKIAGEFTDIDINSDWSFILLSKDGTNITPTLFFSQDKGDSFTEKNIITSPTEVDRFYMGFHEPASGPIVVYAYGMIDGNSPTRFIGLWKSDFDPAPADGTSYFSFVRIEHPTYAYPNGPVPLKSIDTAPGYEEEDSDYYGSINPYTNATWISDFWVSPNDPNRLLTLREKFWGSEDGGIIWERKPQYGGSNWADNRFATMNVAQDTFYWCNDGGVWSIAEADLFPNAADVTASGLSKIDYIQSKVVPKNGDICVSEGSQMDMSQMNKGVFITGGQDIGQIFVRNGRDSHVASADVYRGRIKPEDDSKFITGSLAVTLDGGSDVYEVYNNMDFFPFDKKRLFAFTRKNVTTGSSTTILTRSPAGVDGWMVNNFIGENQANPDGHSWIPTYSNWETIDISSTGISSIKSGTFEPSKANANLAFLGDEVGNRLFMSNNISATHPTWTQLSNAPAASTYRIATHQFNENIIVLATNQGVYISKDKGESWYVRGNFPESSPIVVLLDKFKSEGIYVLTSLNVYYIDETLTDWVEYNKGLPFHKNQDMRIGFYPDGDHRVYVGKYGMGVWTSPLKSALENNNDLPIADFTIHGTSTNQILVGESVQLLDHSVNAETISWIVENGANIHNIGDITSPKLTLNTPGYYKVTLTATNSNGSATKIKERYILVSNTISPLCTPLNDGSLPWYKGFDNIAIDGDNYNVTSLEYYFQADKTFSATTGQSSLLEIDDNYGGQYTMTMKAWIDYNNDGDFDDADELIADSGSNVNDLMANFTPPLSAVINTPLNMRVAADATESPSTCNNNGERQNIDFKIILSNLIQFTSTHTISSVNSANLQSSFSGANNVFEAGFLYSRYNGNFTLDNAQKVKHNGGLSNSDNFNEDINDLEYNVTYYYRPYILDDGGVHYGTVQSFQLSPYKIPLAESIIALNIGNNKWILKGKIFPEDNTFTSVIFQHGENDFSNSETIDISGTSTSEAFETETLVTLDPAYTSYQFRIQLTTADGKTYYSNVHKFYPSQTYCTPTIGTTPWYKRYNKVELNGYTHTESSNAPFEDVSNHVFNMERNGTYVLTTTGTASSWHNLTFLIYIDLNNDGDFNDYHELVGSQSPINSHITPITINIPNKDVVAGQNLRMRVVGYESTPSNVCNIGTGNIKDFRVYIKPISVALKAFLQGPYNGGLMNDNLRSASPVLIPQTEPYTNLGFTHLKEGGGENLDMAVFTTTGNDAIVDWLFVELRDGSNQNNILFTQSALIQRDGDIVSTDGSSALSFKLADSGNYFIGLKHRNHLSLISSSSISLSSITNTYDFSTAQSQAYQPAMHPNESMADLGDGSFGMWAGNTNNDNYIKMTGPFPTNNDYLKLLNRLGASTNYVLDTYATEDINMDGAIKMTGPFPSNNDYLKLLNILGSSTNYITSAQ